MNGVRDEAQALDMEMYKYTIYFVGQTINKVTPAPTSRRHKQSHNASHHRVTRLCLES